MLETLSERLVIVAASESDQLHELGHLWIGLPDGLEFQKHLAIVLKRARLAEPSMGLGGRPEISKFQKGDRN